MEPVFKRLCKECGRSFHGRSDKLFCDDGCRNQFHNRQNCDANNYVRNVNNILRRNRRILDRLYREGQTSIERGELQANGFDFAYHTRIESIVADKQVYYCYEYRYTISNADVVAINGKTPGGNVS